MLYVLLKISVDFMVCFFFVGMTNNQTTKYEYAVQQYLKIIGIT